MTAFELNGGRPVVDPGAFVAHNATVIGDVALGADASVWFNAVVRGDNDPIRIGAGANIQDACVVHSDPGFPVSIGERVTVGHKAMLHGCTVDGSSLVGINAVILNGARVGKHCIIGSNALVTEGKVIADRSLVLGSPGRVVREITDEEIDMLEENADIYIRKIAMYRQQLVEIAQ